MRRGFGHVFRKRARRGGAVVERPGWYIRYTDRRTGRRHEERGGATKREAERKLAQVEQRLWEETHLGRRRLVPGSLADFAPRALARLAAVVTPDTLRGYTKHLDELVAHFGEQQLALVRRDDAQRWITKIAQEDRGRWKHRGARLAPATLRRMVATARRVWFLAADEGLTTENPWSGLELPQVHARAVPYISAQDVRRLYDVVKRRWPRWWAATVVLGETGLRIGELLRVRRDDVLQDGAALLVRRTKTGSPRTIPLTAAARGALAQALAGTDGNALLFATRKQSRFFRVVRAAGLEIGLAGVGLHSLRHAFASGLADAGVPLHHAAELLGHRNLTVTQRYYRHLPAYAGASAVAALEKSRQGN